MAIKEVTYELLVHKSHYPEQTFDMGCAVCDRLAILDIYANWADGSRGLWETVCSEECFNLFVLKDVSTW